MSTPPVSRKYPYENVHGGVMIPPEKLFELQKEPAWKDANIRDTMAEYMRRAAEERGEDDDAEAVQLDPSQPLQLRCALPNKTPEEVNSILAQLQALGVNGTVTLQPATMDQVRRVCDRICAVAAEIAEHMGDQDALGPALDKLLVVRNELVAVREEIRQEIASSEQ